MGRFFDKIRSSQIWQRYNGIPLCLMVSLLSQVIALCFYFIFMPAITEGGLVDTMIDTFREDWYINTFYTEVNASSETASGDDDIIIIDIKDSFSNRQNIADVLRTVSRQNPQMICVDILFTDNDSYDKGMSDYLLETMRDIKDSTKIVVASYKGNEEQICKSFFTDSLGISHGLTDFLGFYEFIPYISDSIPRISTKTAEMIGIDVRNLPHPILINYRSKDFRRRVVKDSIDMAYSLRGLKDKIILVGKYNATEDIHSTPFLINGIHQISGIEILAYELSSLLSFSKNDKVAYRYPYTYINSLWTFLFGFLMSLVYVMLLRMIICSDLSSLSKTILKPLYLILAETFIVFICFAITESYMLIPNIIFFVTSIIFVDILLEILNEIIQKPSK